MKTKNTFVKCGYSSHLSWSCHLLVNISAPCLPTPTATVATTAVPQPGHLHFERPLQLTGPRTLSYANLQFTLTKAVISDRVANDQPQDNTNLALADLTFTVVNTLKDSVSIRSALWQLKLGDGSVYKQPYEDNFASRDTKERMVSFRVPPSAEWKGAQLTLDEQDKEPATLALDGPAQSQQYPAELASGDETTTKEPAMTYTILGASVDVDGAGQRVALGKRYLNLSVRVANKELRWRRRRISPRVFPSDDRRRSFGSGEHE